MRVKIFCILFLILLAFNILADDGPLYIFSADCEKDGSMVITFDRRNSDRIYTENITIKTKYIGNLVVRKSEFDINGTWDFYIIRENSKTVFTSEEALFNERGEYLLIVDYLYNNETYSTTYETECPGFEFSCKLLNVYVDYCKNINNKRFEASARIYGLGKVTNENLTLDNNIQFMLQAEKDYEDYKGKISERGSLPKGVIINNPVYGQYKFNVTNFSNKINSFVAKIIGINYISGGCVNFPSISLYSYKECEDVIIEEIKQEKKEELPSITSQIVKEKEILEEIERNINTKKESKLPIIIIIGIFLLCSIGLLYIIFKRKFNKELDF